MTVNNNIQSQRMNGAWNTSIGDGGVRTHDEPQKAAPKGKWQQLLSGISNRSCAFTHTVKKVFVGIGDVFKGITVKWGRGASTASHMPMQKAAAADEAACKMADVVSLAYHKNANIVMPENILRLLNDGKSTSSVSSIDSDKEMIFDYLLKNPTNHLFSRDNIRCQGDYIFFEKPFPLARRGDDIIFVKDHMTGRALTNVKIDMGPGTHGENIMKVLQDKELTFTSLADLCQKMTANPQRNISAMMTGDAIQIRFNSNKAEANTLLSGEHAERFKQFVSVDASGHYVSNYPFSDLDPPTKLNRVETDSAPSSSNAPAEQPPLSSPMESLSTTHSTITSNEGHVREMAKQFEDQQRDTGNASVQHEAPARNQEISPKIKALQDTLVKTLNHSKPLSGGTRQR